MEDATPDPAMLLKLAFVVGCIEATVGLLLLTGIILNRRKDAETTK